MASPFAITAATNTALLDAKREGAVTFTVTNIGGVALRGRAQAVPQDAKAAKWLTIDGASERAFNIAQTETYTVKIAVPPDAAPGGYPFHLDVVDVDNPDENLTTGQTVTFQVAAAEPVTHPFPWWVLVVAAVILVILGGVGFYFYQDNQTKQAASMTATAIADAGAATATQAALNANATATQVAANANAAATQAALNANATATQVAANASAATLAALNANATATQIALNANATATKAAADATATQAAVVAAAARYNGNWTKEKSAPVGVSGLVIASSGTNVSVHAWSDVRDLLLSGGAAQSICNPDCDWGTRTVAYKSDPLTVDFTVGAAAYQLTIAVTSNSDTLFLNQQTKVGASTFRTAISFFRVRVIIDPVLRVPACRLLGTC